jgi:hypothetical protein
MRHTLKAVFNHRSDAQHVLDELLASGYSRAGTAISDAEGLGAALRHTLARLFAARQHTGTTPDAGAPMQGGHVVTLTADSEPDAERATAIIERFAPVAIEDHLDEWDHHSAGGMPAFYPRGTGPGALQNRSREASHYFGTQNAESPPTGNTFEETMGNVSQWGQPDDDIPAYGYGKAMHDSDRNRNRSWDEVEPDLKSGWEMRDTGASTWTGSNAAIRRGWDAVSPEIDDDSYYRTHWNVRYANNGDSNDYDDHAPAYLYGSEARRSERYRSHHWHDVEPDLETDWETRHAGQLSSWENFKDAVQHGWNRIRT